MVLIAKIFEIAQLCKVSWNMYCRNNFLADADRTALAVWWHLSRHFRYWRLIYNLINVSNVKRKPVGWGLQRSPWQDRHSSRGGWRWHRLAPAIKAMVIVSLEQISFPILQVGPFRLNRSFCAKMKFLTLKMCKQLFLLIPSKTPKSCNSSPSWTRTPRPFRLPLLDSGWSAWMV